MAEVVAEAEPEEEEAAWSEAASSSGYLESLFGRRSHNLALFLQRLTDSRASLFLLASLKRNEGLEAQASFWQAVLPQPSVSWL